MLLIEADLRRPSLASVLGLEHGPGLSTVLRSKEPRVARALQSVEIQPSTGEGENVTIDVLVAGPHPPNSAALMESQAMANLIKAAERDYDLVVIDTSPVGMISDPIPLFDQVSGVVIVVGMKETTMEEATRFKGQLDAMQPPILGVVANFVKPGEGHGAYEYYGEQEPKSPSK